MHRNKLIQKTTRKDSSGSDVIFFFSNSVKVLPLRSQLQKNNLKPEKPPPEPSKQIKQPLKLK